MTVLVTDTGFAAPAPVQIKADMAGLVALAIPIERPGAATIDPAHADNLCARGGYGTVRMMDDLNYDEFMKYPKWVVGFSDITYLHVHISNSIGIQTLSGAMPFSFAKSTPMAIESLKNELFGKRSRNDTVSARVSGAIRS